MVRLISEAENHNSITVSKAASANWVRVIAPKKKGESTDSPFFLHSNHLARWSRLASTDRT